MKTKEGGEITLGATSGDVHVHVEHVGPLDGHEWRKHSTALEEAGEVVKEGSSIDGDLALPADQCRSCNGGLPAARAQECARSVVDLDRHGLGRDYGVNELIGSLIGGEGGLRIILLGLPIIFFICLLGRDVVAVIDLRRRVPRPHAIRDLGEVVACFPALEILRFNGVVATLRGEDGEGEERR